MTKTLAVLAELAQGDVRGDATRAVHGVRHDSRGVKSGDLFVAIAGGKVDGRSFAAAAVASGAAGVVAESPISNIDNMVLVPDARVALGLMSHAVYGDPSRDLDLVGITGTNGKTTSAWALESILSHAGREVARLGTVGARVRGLDVESNFTTPEADDLSRFLRRAVQAGADTGIMEVSSHGLQLERVRGAHFRVGAFLNLSQDHLDFHGTMEKYAEAKCRLFFDHEPEYCVVNIDDPLGATIAGRLRASGRHVWSCSPSGADADIRILSSSASVQGLAGHVETPAGGADFSTELVGQHNLENACVALGCGLALGHDLETLLAGLAITKGAPGRLQLVESDSFAVFVDYAHTPDALRNSIHAVRTLTDGRVIVVFGCGGDRDRGKRPQMGRIADQDASIAIITSDNPRTEDPSEIVDAIAVSMTGDALSIGQLSSADGGWIREEDRRAAITLALHAAGPGDSVLIAGKGHENYQLVGTTKLAFDDTEVAQSVLRELR